MIIEGLLEQERTMEEMRRRAHEREMQEEQDAKRRVKDDLMDALVSSMALHPEVNLLVSFVRMATWIKY